MAIKTVDQNVMKIEAQRAQSSMVITPYFLPEIHMPYAGRAARFLALAQAHPLAAYLKFCARLSYAQELAAQAFKPALDEKNCKVRTLQGLSPLDVEAALSLNKAFLVDVLKILLTSVKTGSDLSQEVCKVVDELAAMSNIACHALATDIVQGEQNVNKAQAPFVSAALQVIFNRLAAQLDFSALEPSLHRKDICPVCGSAPVGGCIRPGTGGLRYLHCSLCETQWHCVRATCSQCDATGSIEYWTVEKAESPMRAESCGDCHGYIKLLNPEKILQADVIADDLATLSLDIAMDEQGFRRIGPNPLCFL